MKNLSKIVGCILVGAALLTNQTNASAWGQKGHDVTCAIAQRHLSKSAQAHISEVFDGKSLVYWANWLDNASHTPAFAYTKTWHYKNIDADETYETAAQNPSGDVITAINAQVEALKSGKLNKEAEAIALRMLVHLVGDLHCPMHMGHKSDLGGNKWQVQYFRSGKNLHGIFDTDIVEGAHKWTHSEWAEEIDIASPAKVKAISEGSVEDWGKETYEVCKKVYETTPEGSKLSYDYVNEWAPVIEEQFLKGGIRLAAILNEIYK